MAGRDAGRERGGDVGNKIGRPAEDHFSSTPREQVRVGTRHAAVKNVADDDDTQSFETLLVVGDGEGVKQGLRGMLMQSVAGIDDGHRDNNATAGRGRRYWDGASRWRLRRGEVTVQPVSMSDSPFSMLDDVAVIRVVVAPSALAANSNDVRVRVEGS